MGWFIYCQIHSTSYSNDSTINIWNFIGIFDLPCHFLCSFFVDVFAPLVAVCSYPWYKTLPTTREKKSLLIYLALFSLSMFLSPVSFYLCKFCSITRHIRVNDICSNIWIGIHRQTDNCHISDVGGRGWGDKWKDRQKEHETRKSEAENRGISTYSQKGLHTIRRTNEANDSKSFKSILFYTFRFIPHPPIEFIRVYDRKSRL